MNKEARKAIREYKRAELKRRVQQFFCRHKFKVMGVDPVTYEPKSAKCSKCMKYSTELKHKIRWL